MSWKLSLAQSLQAPASAPLSHGGGARGDWRAHAAAVEDMPTPRHPAPWPTARQPMDRTITTSMMVDSTSGETRGRELHESAFTTPFLSRGGADAARTQEVAASHEQPAERETTKPVRVTALPVGSFTPTIRYGSADPNRSLAGLHRGRRTARGDGGSAYADSDETGEDHWRAGLRSGEERPQPRPRPTAATAAAASSSRQPSSWPRDGPPPLQEHWQVGPHPPRAAADRAPPLTTPTVTPIDADTHATVLTGAHDPDGELLSDPAPPELSHAYRWRRRGPSDTSPQAPAVTRWTGLQVHLRARTQATGVVVLDLSTTRLEPAEWRLLCHAILPQLAALEELLLADMGLTDDDVRMLLTHGCMVGQTVVAEPAATAAPTAGSSGLRPAASASGQPLAPHRRGSPHTVTRRTGRGEGARPAARSLPRLRTFDLSGNAFSHRSANSLGKFLLWTADTLESFHLAGNALGDYGVRVLAIYLAKLNVDTLQSDPSVLAPALVAQHAAAMDEARLQRRSRDPGPTPSSTSAVGARAEHVDPARGLPRPLAALHIGPSLLDLRSCRASVRGVTEVLAGVSRAHRVATLQLSQSTPGALALVRSGVLMSQAPLSHVLPLDGPNGLTSIDLRAVPLSQTCSPLCCRELLLNLFFCCPQLDTLDVSDSFEGSLVSPAAAGKLIEVGLTQQRRERELRGRHAEDAWRLFLEEEGEVSFSLADGAMLGGQTRVGDVLAELIAHVAYCASIRRQPVPAAFAHVRELHLRGTGLTDLALRGIVVALRGAVADAPPPARDAGSSSSSSSGSVGGGVLQSLAVLNVAENYLTASGCARLLYGFVVDWPLQARGLPSSLVAVALQGNAGVTKEQDVRAVEQAAHAALAHRRAENLERRTRGRGGDGGLPLSIQFGPAASSRVAGGGRGGSGGGGGGGDGSAGAPRPPLYFLACDAAGDEVVARAAGPAPAPPPPHRSLLTALEAAGVAEMAADAGHTPAAPRGSRPGELYPPQRSVLEGDGGLAVVEPAEPWLSTPAPDRAPGGAVGKGGVPPTPATTAVTAESERDGVRRLVEDMPLANTVNRYDHPHPASSSAAGAGESGEDGSPPPRVRYAAHLVNSNPGLCAAATARQGVGDRWAAAVAEARAQRMGRGVGPREAGPVLASPPGSRAVELEPGAAAEGALAGSMSGRGGGEVSRAHPSEGRDPRSTTAAPAGDGTLRGSTGASGGGHSQGGSPVSSPAGAPSSGHSRDSSPVSPPRSRHPRSRSDRRRHTVARMRTFFLTYTHPPGHLFCHAMSVLQSDHPVGRAARAALEGDLLAILTPPEEVGAGSGSDDAAEGGRYCRPAVERVGLRHEELAESGTMRLEVTCNERRAVIAQRLQDSLNTEEPEKQERLFARLMSVLLATPHWDTVEEVVKLARSSAPVRRMLRELYGGSATEAVHQHHSVHATAELFAALQGADGRAGEDSSAGHSIERLGRDEPVDTEGETDAGPSEKVFSPFVDETESLRGRSRGGGGDGARDGRDLIARSNRGRPPAHPARTGSGRLDLFDEVYHTDEVGGGGGAGAGGGQGSDLRSVHTVESDTSMTDPSIIEARADALDALRTASEHSPVYGARRPTGRPRRASSSFCSDGGLAGEEHVGLGEAEGAAGLLRMARPAPLTAPRPNPVVEEDLRASPPPEPPTTRNTVFEAEGEVEVVDDLLTPPGSTRRRRSPASLELDGVSKPSAPPASDHHTPMRVSEEGPGTATRAATAVAVAADMATAQGENGSDEELPPAPPPPVRVARDPATLVGRRKTFVMSYAHVEGGVICRCWRLLMGDGSQPRSPRGRAGREGGHDGGETAALRAEARQCVQDDFLALLQPADEDLTHSVDAVTIPFDDAGVSSMLQLHVTTNERRATIAARLQASLASSNAAAPTSGPLLRAPRSSRALVHDTPGTLASITLAADGAFFPRLLRLLTAHAGWDMLACVERYLAEPPRQELGRRLSQSYRGLPTLLHYHHGTSAALAKELGVESLEALMPAAPRLMSAAATSEEGRGERPRGVAHHSPGDGRPLTAAWENPTTGGPSGPSAAESLAASLSSSSSLAPGAAAESAGERAAVRREGGRGVRVSTPLSAQTSPTASERSGSGGRGGRGKAVSPPRSLAVSNGRAGAAAAAPAAVAEPAPSLQSAAAPTDTPAHEEEAEANSISGLAVSSLTASPNPSMFSQLRGAHMRDEQRLPPHGGQALQIQLRHERSEGVPAPRQPPLPTVSEWDRLRENKHKRLLRLAYDSMAAGVIPLDTHHQSRQRVAKGKWDGQRVQLAIEWEIFVVLYFERPRSFSSTRRAQMLVHPVAIGFTAGRSPRAGEENHLLVQIHRPVEADNLGLSMTSLARRLDEGAQLTASRKGGGGGRKPKGGADASHDSGSAAVSPGARKELELGVSSYTRRLLGKSVELDTVLKSAAEVSTAVELLEKSMESATRAIERSMEVSGVPGGPKSTDGQGGSIGATIPRAPTVP